MDINKENRTLFLLEKPSFLDYFLIIFPFLSNEFHQKRLSKIFGIAILSQKISYFWRLLSGVCKKVIIFCLFVS